METQWLKGFAVLSVQTVERVNFQALPFFQHDFVGLDVLAMSDRAACASMTVRTVFGAPIPGNL